MATIVDARIEGAEVRGRLENNQVADWQVTVKIGLTVDTDV